jgi:hypothetical protein
MLFVHHVRAALVIVVDLSQILIKLLGREKSVNKVTRVIVGSLKLIARSPSD